MSATTTAALGYVPAGYRPGELARRGPSPRPVLTVVATDRSARVHRQSGSARSGRRFAAVAAAAVLGAAALSALGARALVDAPATTGGPAGGAPTVDARADGAPAGGAVVPAGPAGPADRAVIVRPGDSLWAIAERLEPGVDPRPIVDALSRARHGAPLVPGEAIVWRR